MKHSQTRPILPWKSYHFFDIEIAVFGVSLILRPPLLSSHSTNCMVNHINFQEQSTKMAAFLSWNPAVLVDYQFQEMLNVLPSLTRYGEQWSGKDESNLENPHPMGLSLGEWWIITANCWVKWIIWLSGQGIYVDLFGGLSLKNQPIQRFSISTSQAIDFDNTRLRGTDPHGNGSNVVLPRHHLPLWPL